ncbi:MAG: hypothetical protein AAGJ93_00125 [Bacteroidota bacterium]
MQLHNLLKFSLFLLTPLFLGQCTEASPSDKQERIFANFEVRYLAEDLQLRGYAYFSQGDSVANNQALSLANGVAFMGSGTTLKTLPEGVIRYENTFKLDYVSPLRFSFTLPQQEEAIELSFPMDGINDFAVTSATKKNGLRIDLDGDLAKDESLLLLFTDSDNATKTIVRPGPLTKEDLFIPSDALLHFKTGDYRLFMLKSKETAGVMDELEYQAIIEFYTQEKAFTLVE